jgi:hypothetical protein
MGYIYTLNCPITNEPKYIGQTIRSLEKRLQMHCYCYGYDKKQNWIRQLKKYSLLPFIEILEECDNSELNFMEKYWISQFKSWGFVLVNTTEGGESLPKSLESIEKMTRTMNTEEVKEKLRKGKMGEENPAKRDYVRKKISIANSNYSKRKVYQYDSDNNFIREWRSAKEAALIISEEKNKTYHNVADSISKCILNKTKSAYGYIWKSK